MMLRISQAFDTVSSKDMFSQSIRKQTSFPNLRFEMVMYFDMLQVFRSH